MKRKKRKAILPEWAYEVNELFYSRKVQGWCGLPYPNHPKGCPNFKVKQRCPFHAPLIDKVIDVNKPVYFVHSEFDLEGHVNKMKKAHPGWTERQCRNVLYWQSRSKKQARERAQELLRLIHIEYPFLTGGEANGIHVYRTAASAGLKLERIKGLKTCRHIIFIGWRKV